jgi:hypothetical protein
LALQLAFESTGAGRMAMESNYFTADRLTLKTDREAA